MGLVVRSKLCNQIKAMGGQIHVLCPEPHPVVMNLQVEEAWRESSGIIVCTRSDEALHFTLRPQYMYIDYSITDIPAIY